MENFTLEDVGVQIPLAKNVRSEVETPNISLHSDLLVTVRTSIFPKRKFWRNRYSDILVTNQNIDSDNIDVHFKEN